MANDTTPHTNGVADPAADAAPNTTPSTSTPDPQAQPAVAAGSEPGTADGPSAEAAAAAPPAPPLPSWDDLGLHPDVKSALDEMGYLRPTAVQATVFKPVSEGKDLLVQSKTGTGKTTAFGLPTLNRLVPTHRAPQALILCPTRELAIQVARELTAVGKNRGIVVEPIYGGAPIGKQITNLQNGVHIVVGTPGRVLDHIGRRTLDTKAISTFILDECDEMLSMGFLEDIERVVSHLPEKKQTLLFSATMPDEVGRYARRHMRAPEQISLSRDQVSISDIHHAYYIVSGVARSRDLLKILYANEPESAIIFCNMRDETTMVAKYLQKQGLDAEPLSSDLSQADRERVMGRMKAKTLRYLCATDVAARGIDISNLSHVINFTVPESPEVYVHRTGRTGRAGKKGTAISMVGPRELGNFRYVRLQFGIKPEERVLPKDDIFEGKLKVALPPVGTPQPPDPVQILIRGVQAEAPTDLEKSIFEKLYKTEAGKRVLAKLVAERLDKLSTRAKPKRTAGDASASTGTGAGASSSAGGERDHGERPLGGDRGERGSSFGGAGAGGAGAGGGERERRPYEGGGGGGERERRPYEGGGDRGRDRGERRPYEGNNPRFRDAESGAAGSSGATGATGAPATPGADAQATGGEARAERTSFGDRGGERGDRYGRDRGDRGDRYGRDRGDRGGRSFGDRDRGERPASADGAPSGERPVGETPSTGERTGSSTGGTSGTGSAGGTSGTGGSDRGERSSSGDRGERGFRDRNDRGDRGDRGGRDRYSRDRGERGDSAGGGSADGGMTAGGAAAGVAAEGVTAENGGATGATGATGEQSADSNRGDRGDRGGRDRGGRDRDRGDGRQRREWRDRSEPRGEQRTDGRNDRGASDTAPRTSGDSDEPTIRVPVAELEATAVGTEAAPPVETAGAVDDVARAALQRADRGERGDRGDRGDRGGRPAAAPAAAADDKKSGRGGKRAEPTTETREFWETWAEEKSTRTPAPAAASPSTAPAASADDSASADPAPADGGGSRGRGSRGGRDRGGRGRSSEKAAAGPEAEAPVVSSPEPAAAKPERAARGDRAAKPERGEKPDKAEKPAGRSKRESTAPATTETSSASSAPAAAAGGDAQARLFVNLGKKHGVSADDLRALLAGAVGGDKERIGSVSLRDAHAHVRVPEALAEQIIAGVHGTQHKDQDVTVERARA